MEQRNDPFGEDLPINPEMHPNQPRRSPLMVGEPQMPGPRIPGMPGQYPGGIPTAPSVGHSDLYPGGFAVQPGGMPPMSGGLMGPGHDVFQNPNNPQRFPGARFDPVGPQQPGSMPGFPPGGSGGFGGPFI